MGYALVWLTTESWSASNIFSSRNSWIYCSSGTFSIALHHSFVTDRQDSGTVPCQQCVSSTNKQTPAVRAFTGLCPANSSCGPGSMMSHDSSAQFRTAAAPWNLKASMTGQDTDASWRSSDQLLNFDWFVTGSCDSALCVLRPQKQVPALSEQVIPLAHWESCKAKRRSFSASLVPSDCVKCSTQLWGGSLECTKPWTEGEAKRE